MTRSLDTPDPLAAAIEPPENETPAERWAREQAEAEARRISEQIDDQIKAEKLAMRKRKPPIKVLLLGQSESGKSTTVKNFQMAYAYSSFLAERAAWRAVIHLNLVRSVTSIMNILAQEFPASSIPLDNEPPLNPLEEDDDEDDKASVAPTASLLDETHNLLIRRLSPLRDAQRALERSLGAASNEEVNGGHGSAAPWESAKFRPREFAVTSRSGWKAALNRVRGMRDDADNGKGGATERPKHQHRASITRTSEARNSDSRHELEGTELGVERAAEVITSCASDMHALWTDTAVRAVLDKRGVRPEEWPGFFLNDVKRVADKDYQPSDDDVVRARLRTMGVQEHRFIFEKGSETGREWLIYDVGGARSLRHAWYPYFDDINAIIFLAPISCFDETLAEDKRVNRLQDSMQLWKAVCSTKLLAKVQLILFLNKCDLLQKKLARGVRVVDWIPTYHDRPNDAPSAAKYFRGQFKDALTKYSPEPRSFYSYLTSVVVS
ncbi:G-alpha-domain-containing protein [Dichomitus squalens]|uniref:G-alpha-domain-containing protein n=1 Tax=Dichomitus squalens TaxID=114155 RepID=A0A4Q9NF87_9APHY|nr:G-alpha-domain-containing protein [Dichomitus squalens]TBU64257.1 G-alpha-domain-containing protein [Dichomitus squalens]